MNVKFFLIRLQETYDNLESIEEFSLYWIEETQRLYKGTQLFGTGAEATEELAGLLSAEDKKIISSIPTYEIEKQSSPEEGFAATYKFKKITNGYEEYVGDVINIAKDLVLQSASLQTVTIENYPYDGAVIGDPYLELIFNDDKLSSIYIPVKDLVDIYTPGNGITILDHVIKVNIANEAHGLIINNDGSLALALASKDADGAMSKNDKAALDNLIENTYSKSEVEALIAQACSWTIV